MTDAELAASAGHIVETVTKTEYPDGAEYKLDVDNRHWFLKEPYEIACRFLQLLPPADARELVTEEWVKAVLPACGSPCPGSVSSAVYPGGVAELSWAEWGSRHPSLAVYVNREGINWWVMTRDRFRDLARGLGVNLKE